MIGHEEERLAAVAELRSWLGTPWAHQGRTRGVGVDCIGVALVIAQAAHAFDDPGAVVPQNYSRLPRMNQMRKFIEQHMSVIEKQDALVGDIVLVAWHTHPTHLMVLSDQTPGCIRPPFNIIHANNARTVSVVTERPLGSWRGMSVTGCYRFRRWA